jgi:hypothetical protein
MASAVAAAGDREASAVLNGSAGGPPNGALIMTTDRKMSGRTTAHQPASGEP